MPSACLPLYTPASILNRKPHNFHPAATVRKFHNNSITCRASSSSSSSITEFDLYDLLGVESSSSPTQIKTAYRSLQKRCHPDVAGAAGHEMAIILNEAYSVLSDPCSRLEYDKEQAKIAELQGYTGKPMYSMWLGSESEARAVFVDEVKCVGCLKCALFAEKTFAIESAYGRARVVAQWADSEHKIQEAIEACPVDCISIVERSDLAALEFLMSKQPRGNVRVGAGNAVGTRVSNIFVDAKKFQTRFHDAINKNSTNSAKDTNLQREARISAVQAIKAISNWLYWQSPSASTWSCQKLVHIPGKSAQPNIDKLREAVAARKQAREFTRSTTKTPSTYIYDDEYWVPSALALPVMAAAEDSSGHRAATETPSTTVMKQTSDKSYTVSRKKSRNPLIWGVPTGMASVAAAIIWFQAEEGSVGELKEHVGGSLALGIVNSSSLQVILAGITWYLIGIALVEVLDAFWPTREQ